MKVKDLKTDLPRLLHITCAPKSLMNCKCHELQARKSFAQHFLLSSSCQNKKKFQRPRFHVGTLIVQSYVVLIK